MKITIEYTKANIVALIGLGLVQCALIPSHIYGTYPDVSLPALICAGLCCYLYKAVVDGDAVYIFSNIVGLILNGSMVIRILIGA